MHAIAGKPRVRHEEEYTVDWQPSFGWCWRSSKGFLTNDRLADEILKRALRAVSRPDEQRGGLSPFDE